MITFPQAKINLGLRITRRRADGYHDIETIFYPAGLSDGLEFVVSPEQPGRDTLTVTGIDPGGNPGDNLVMKACRRMHELYSFPWLKIHLHKTIPAGAGLGGGSSDAAFLLRTVNKFFDLSADIDRLKEIAVEIGSDCPFFIDCKPSLGKGRGEILKEVAPVLQESYMVLLNPGIHINTREAYQHCHPAEPETSLDMISELPSHEWKNLIVNDFEEYAFSRFPLLAEIKEKLYASGAYFSLMSGSGSSVYGLFNSRPDLDESLKKFVIWEGLM